MRIVLAICVAALLLFFFTKGERVEPDMNREGLEISVIPNAYDSQGELYKDLKSKGFKVGKGLVGFAVWSPEDRVCDIYYVRPSKVDDDNMLTMGHELAHCIYGEFHK